MIEETAAVGVRVERPALRVDHAAWRMVFGVDVPEFLDAQPIDLRLAITVERELRLEHLGQMAAHPFGEKRIFRMEFEAGGIVRRSEEHTSELQSLMRISYAVFCLKKKKNKTSPTNKHTSL